MFLYSDLTEISLPLVNPVIKFLLILTVILFAPLLLNKIKIPHLLGLIIAGAVIGPHGMHLIDRDSSIILSGTAGLLYIMFLSGLEIDLADFKKNIKKSAAFGLYTFLIPMCLGILTGLYILEFSIMTSVLLASMFASHTLIAYPLVSKMGVAKNRAVNITVGGTMITDILALLVLAIIVKMAVGDVDASFWITLIISLSIFIFIVWVLFPIIGRWFFITFEDNVSQYIFVLVMVFLGATLAEIAGVEAIIGAFLSGLALNRLIPHSSPLMNRIDFVGNAIFIPFFLIGVGMLIDYRVFFEDLNTIKVAAVMTIVATLSKFMAAYATQKTFRFSRDERRLIFGLSNAQAAATLAAVTVGYNIIIGTTAAGTPIRLLDESVLNGTILMILITCTIASFIAQKGAKNIVLSQPVVNETHPEDKQEKILIPVSNINTVEELINLSNIIKSVHGKLYALHIVDTQRDVDPDNHTAKRILNKAAHTAAAVDVQIKQLIRYDHSVPNGIASAIKEQNITELVLGLHHQKNTLDSFFGNMTEVVLKRCATTTLIYNAKQPLATVKRHLIVVPEKAEKEIGFPFWLIKVWNIARNTGGKLVFYGSQKTLDYIKDIHHQYPVGSTFIEFQDWNDFLILSRDIKTNDNLIIVMSRKEGVSYHVAMKKIPEYLRNYFKNNSSIIIYPIQTKISNNSSEINLKNPSILEPFEKLDDVAKTILRIFRRKYELLEFSVKEM